MEQNKDQDCNVCSGINGSHDDRCGAAVRGEAVVEERWCLACNKAGHRTDECRSTLATNTPQARELLRLCHAADPVSARAADAPSEPTFVWIVGSKTFSQVFVSEKAARAFVSHLPPSVSGGISITKSVVIGKSRAADALDSQPEVKSLGDLLMPKEQRDRILGTNHALDSQPTDGGVRNG